jgi:hypothetical protein
MGDPRGCATHLRTLLKPDGTWMIVEPIAGDKPGDNVINPVSRLYYNASTMICVPTSLAGTYEGLPVAAPTHHACPREKLYLGKLMMSEARRLVRP